MKRQIKKQISIIATFFVAFVLLIGVGSISAMADEGESTLSLSLIGNSTIYLQKGTEYKEFGAIAYDSVEGDLTESIIINNTVNKDAVGTYTVSYRVSNGADQTATASRTVIVFENILEENRYTKWYSSYSSSNNRYERIVPTRDGGFLLAGQMYDGSYCQLYFCKYDYDMNYQWSKAIFVGSSYYSNYLFDVVELSDGNFLVLSRYYYGYYGTYYYYTSVISGSNGDRITFDQLDYSYTKILQINENQYALCAEGYGLFSVLTYNPETRNYTTNKVTTSFSINNPVVLDGYIFSLQSSGTMYKMDLETLETSSFESGLVLNTCVEECHEDYIYFCDGKTIYKMDGNFNIVKTFMYRESTIQQIYVNDTNVVAKYGQTIVFLNDALEYVGETKTQETFTARDLYLDNDGNVYYCGQYYSSYYYCGLVKISNIKLFTNTSDLHCELNQEIDYYNGVGIYDISGKSLGTFTCDYSQVDNTQAGNYQAYYTFTAIDDEGIKTYYVGRDIIVEPTTTFEDGAVYSGSKVVDVEGGSVTINGISYSYGDVYNIPGESTMVITGENGYIKTISFAIELVVNGVEDGKTYYTPVIPDISGGALTLDGEPYINGTAITTKGNHTLEIGSLDCSITNSNSSYPFKLIDGIYTSTNKQGYSDSTLTFRFNSDGKFAFTYWVSSEGNCDWLTINKNGYQIARISGQTSKESRTIDVVAGDYITFTYSHDGSVASGSDAAYVIVSAFHEAINFTIEPTIIGVSDGQTYTETLSPNINAETMTLNGEAYNNELIENCGNYTLTITGTNGYTKTITFIIETVISNLTNGETYDEEVTPTFTKGTATLNGEPYVSGTTIYTPGLNTLVVTGEDGYSVTYKFTINLGIENVAQGETYIGEVTPFISGGIITLNDQPYVSGTKIDVPGYYTITVLGADGYRNDIHFVVKPYEVNVVNGETYNHSVIPVVSNGSLTLNDAPYTSGTVINTSGEYTLVIIGENGYYESITFMLVTGANVEDGEHYNDPVTLKFVGIATLNGVDVLPDTIVEKVGNYQLVLIDGENTFTYNFVIEPDYSIFDGRITSCVIDFANCIVTLNGETVTNAVELTAVGNYTVVIEGENGYTKTINFAICSETNVENGGQYASGLVVNANGGSIELNGEEFTDGTILTEVGTYTLRISGENGHEETIVFNILPEVSNINNSNVYCGSVVPNIIGGTLTLNGEEYISGTAITEEGVYQLVISGVGGYTQRINFVVLSEEFEIKEDGIYMQSMSLTHNVCDMEVNGTAYSVGTAINTVGKNTLTFIYNGERTDITFYIFPLISGVENSMVYEGSATPTVEWNNLLLDGNPYVSGTPITEVGYHTLTVANLNGYNYEITFTVTEIWENIEEDGRYEYSVTPETNNGTLYLNGNAFSSGTTIYQVGNHTMKIVGVNGYENEITFTITERISGLENGKEYTGSVYPSVSNATLNLNGNSYSSGSSIYNVGFHTLTVMGVNGYISEYRFTILPTITGVEEGKEYLSASVHASCSYATLKLNGEAYSSGTYIYDVGNHEIEIIGVNGYSQTISFTVKEKTSITDGEEANYSKAVSVDYLSNFRDTVVKLDGEILTSSKTIYEIGYHTLTIEGANGYRSEKTFTINANWSGVSNGSSYTSKNGVYLRLRSSSSSSSILSETYYEKILLDGREFSNDTYCYVVGNHKFEIHGANGYVETIEFVIDPVVEKLLDASNITIKNDSSYPFTLSGDVYTSTNKSNNSTSVFTITAKTDIELTLNYFVSSEANYDKLIIVKGGNEIVNVSGSPGWAEREISLNAGEVMTISYRKDGSTSRGDDCAKFKLNLKSNGSGTKFVPDIYLDNTNTYQDENTYVLLDGQPYVFQSTIDTVGYHTLTVMGVGGYEKEFKFTVIPDVSDIVDDGIYVGAVTPKFDRCEALLDGAVYVSGTPICAVGYHTLEMVGVNGYILRYDFTVTPTGVEEYRDKVFSKEIAVRLIENATLYLNGERYNGERIVSLGYHTIKIEGTNGYEESFGFTVAEDPVIKDATGYQTFDDGFTTEYMVNISIPHADLFIDDIAYESGTDYYTVGLHYLRIVGENGYEKEYTFTLTEKVPGLVDGKEYTSLQLDCNHVASVALNGQEVDDHTKVYLVGNYTLVVKGTNGYTNEYHFTIGPDLKNVTNEGVYNSSIAPVINAETIYLNGEAFVSGTSVAKVGHHVLRIEGVGGYTHEITFTIDANIQGVENGGQYVTNVIPVFNHATATLDGKTFTSGTPILESQVGVHRLRIIGVGGYTKEYVFTVEPVVNGLSQDQIYQGSVSPIVNGGTVKLNGVEIDLNLPITAVGNHTLTIHGTNGYVHAISFTLEPVIENLRDGYSQSFQPTILGSGMTITLNGSPYVQGTEIKTVGNNKLVINGHGGYTKAFTITIDPLINGIEDNAVVFGGVAVKATPTAVLTIDGEEYADGALYTKVGHHTVRIIGVNGYEKLIKFTLREDSSTISAVQYTEAFKLEFDPDTFSILIDGKNYSSNTAYYAIGIHELQVIGSNGYTNSYEITVIPKLSGVEHNGIYGEQVSVTTLNGTFYIDGVAYKTGDVIKSVGNHTLTMKGSGDYTYSMTFTVTPKVSGIAAGGSYSSSVTWDIPADCTATLDGASVNVHSSTQKIGHHTMVIEGANGYRTSIDFTVTESLNITDGNVYDRAMTIDIPDCSAVLNDLEISGLYELTTPGSYTLTVFGTNGYSSEYTFSVVAVLSGVADGQEYNGSVMANTSIGQWYLDDEPYVSGTLITEIGHHTLKVSGPNYEQICSFTITVDVTAYAESPKNFNFANAEIELYVDGIKYTYGELFNQVGNHTVEYRGANGYISRAEFTIEHTYSGNADYKYQDSALIDIPNATLFVNGTKIENMTEITSIGNNVITVQGANGYERTIEIFIAPTLSVANGEERDEKISIEKLDATMYLDGVIISEDTVVNKHGTHTLRIEGANGYVEEISFTYNNPNYSYVIMMSVVVGLMLIAFVVIMISRRKVL